MSEAIPPLVGQGWGVVGALCASPACPAGRSEAGPQLPLRRAAPARPSGNRFCLAGASKVGALILPASRPPPELCLPPRPAACHRPGLTKPRRPKAQSLPKNLGICLLLVPQTEAPAQGQSLACREIQAQCPLNFGWDSGLGFSRGRLGGAGRPEAPLALSHLWAAPPLCSPGLASHPLWP